VGGFGCKCSLVDMVSWVPHEVLWPLLAISRVCAIPIYGSEPPDEHLCGYLSVRSYSRDKQQPCMKVCCCMSCLAVSA
jgi:hypothetical protein